MKDFYYYEKQFSRRLSELRIKKGVSAREMSLALGQNESYINRIENGHAFPSMQCFFYICEYLNISPSEFFIFDESQMSIGNISVPYNLLSEKQQKLVLAIIVELLDNH